MHDPDAAAATGATIPDPSSPDESPRAGAGCAAVREPLAPKDHAEAVAIFRSQVIGPLLTRHLEGHGDLAATLREVCAEPHRPPWSNVSYRYAISTVERSRALLSLILVGLPETRSRLQLGKNRSLWSRIHTRTELSEGGPPDTAEYLQHRLGCAGASRELFTSDAIALLHEASEGRLRDVDRIATAALKAGAKRKLRQIDRGVIASIASEEDAID